MNDTEKAKRKAISLGLRDENRKWRARDAALQKELEELKTQVSVQQPQQAARPRGDGDKVLALFIFVLAPPLLLIATSADVGEWIAVVCAQGVLGVLYLSATASPDERKDWDDRSRFGPLNPELLCQHCGTKGHVRTQTVSRKKGVSGGKATAAVLTGGVSLLATGLSRKEKETEAHCTNCRSTWHF